MARLGIDFGTTNTIATIHDRGMFSVVLHKAKTGAGTIVQETFPSAILIDGKSGRRWFGLEADRRFVQLGPAAGSAFVPSLKRQLRHYAQGRAISADAGGSGSTSPGSSGGTSPSGPSGPDFNVAELLTAFLQALADSIRHSQSLPTDEPLEAVITWPANANGAQRHITRKCFRQAGFEVLDTLNEPTAAAIELADCLTAGRRKKKPESGAVAVFDLGGGTFDASVVWVDGTDFHVLASGGIEHLGGDDLDHLLLDMFLSKVKVPVEQISPLTRHALDRQARQQKEAISTGTVKSLFLNPQDFGLPGRPVTIRVAAFYDRIRPLLFSAMSMLRSVVAAAAAKEPRITDGPDLTIYLVGGSSKLPLVADMVSDAFPHSRLVITDKPFRSVAIGAAICAMDRVTYRDVFARHFGLIRLRDRGQAEHFDTIFPAGTPIPRKGEPPVEKVAWYHPAHNVGHLRYLECTALGANGMPDEGVRTWSDILFPYDPSYALSAPLSREQIMLTDRFAREPVCEVYRCDSDGVITVELRRPSRNEARCYEIYQE